MLDNNSVNSSIIYIYQSTIFGGMRFVRLGEVRWLWERLDVVVDSRCAGEVCGLTVAWVSDRGWAARREDFPLTVLSQTCLGVGNLL